MIDLINLQLKDNTKARLINYKQDNTELNTSTDKKVRSQYDIYEYLKNKV